VRTRRGPRPQPLVEYVQRFAEVKDDSWERPVAALAAMLAQPPWSGARTRVVLADHWARYVIVPWVGALSSQEERLAHAQQLLASAYGEGIAEWDVRISDGPPHAALVACALPPGLAAAVAAACVADGTTLVSLQPQLIEAYAAWRHCLPQSKSWFVSIEQGSLAAARLSSSGWDRVRSVRIGGDWMRELKRLQTFGRLAGNSPEEGQVYVDAPRTWRELAVTPTTGTDISGLQWLEEPQTPVTTLQRLGRARRLAA
jgi:hypothetical protein